MINNIRFWIRHNRRKQQQYYHGKYWMVATLADFVRMYPYWTLHQVRRLLDSLLRQGVLMTSRSGRFNTDRTLSYTFVDDTLIEGYASWEDVQRPIQEQTGVDHLSADETGIISTEAHDTSIEQEYFLEYCPTGLCAEEDFTYMWQWYVKMYHSLTTQESLPVLNKTLAVILFQLLNEQHNPVDILSEALRLNCTDLAVVIARQ